MKKQQLILIGSGVILFCLIYFFGRTVPVKSKSSPLAAAPKAEDGHEHIDINTILKASKQELTPQQQVLINQLEAGIVKGDMKDQQIKVYRKIAAFWKDSAHMLLPYAYYSGQASKLENSEKSLTFAAHYFLDGVRRQSNPEMKSWMATQAKELFEQALKVNPANDSTKIGLGSCYLFGGISGNPMQGIQLIREVVQRDPENIYGQFMLGLGAVESKQFDKAIERLSKVVSKQPQNIEAVLNLAEAYEQHGDKQNAIKWYEQSKTFFQGDAEIIKEIDQRIETLQR